VCTAAAKLEELILETRAHRAPHCRHSDDDILEEDTLKDILDDWKDNYQQWMRPETLDQSRTLAPQKWHQRIRTAFRSHLFQIVGSFEMVVFFIVAPFSNENLLVFRYFVNQVAWEQMPDEDRNGRILDLSKAYVRPTRVVR